MKQGDAFDMPRSQDYFLFDNRKNG